MYRINTELYLLTRVYINSHLKVDFQLQWGGCNLWRILSIMISTIAYIASMFEVDYKEWGWLIFRFKRFGMRPDSVGYLQYSDDKQDWGLHYGTGMLVHLLATVFTALCIKYGNLVFELSLKDYPVLSSIGLILSVTCWLIFIAFYMTTKDKHKYKKLVYFNRASLFIVVYTYSIVTKNIVFLWVLLTIALLKIIVAKVFKDNIKEQVSKNIYLANIYPVILILSADMMLVKTSVKALLLIGAVTLVIFYMLVVISKVKWFDIQEAFGYKLLGDAKFIDIDVNKSILYKVYVMNAVCLSLLYFGIYSIYALVVKDISIISAIPRIFGVFIFLLIVVTTFITLSKKEEKE